jgi:hypothetical protein
MRPKLATLLIVLNAVFSAFLGVSAALAQAWPALPATGFVSGRPATDKDVADGNALFVLKAHGVYFGKPVDIVIPQYAYLLNKGSEPVPVIVIQAEQERNIKIFGVRGLDGDPSVVKEPELQLLGAKPPG